MNRFRLAFLVAMAGVAAFAGTIPTMNWRRCDTRRPSSTGSKRRRPPATSFGYLNGAGNRIIPGCVAHPTLGAMGYHYFNKALIDDLVIDPLRPEGLVYAPGADGGLKLVAVEYVVPGPASNPDGPAEAPTVFGMQMHILVPAVGFLMLHAWIWSHNPSGIFAHWNPEVTCP